MQSELEKNFIEIQTKLLENLPKTKISMVNHLKNNNH